MITVENVSFSYPGGQEVLHEVNLQINDGEFVAIMGENGDRPGAVFSSIRWTPAKSQWHSFQETWE